MAEKLKIFELDIDVDGIIKRLADLKGETDKLKAAQKGLDTSTQKGREQFVKNDAAIKNLNAEYRSKNKVLTDLTATNQRANTVGQKVNALLNKETQSISGARKSNADLLKIRNELNLSTEQGRKALDRINKKVDQNNKFIKDNASQLEKQKIGIGNYESAVTGAASKVNILGINLGTITTKLFGAQKALIAKRNATLAASGATGGLNKALKLFRIALISTGIGAIVVALGSLIAAFASTQKGTDAINKALAPLKGTFQAIIGIAQDLALKLSGAFTSPQDAVKKLWELIKSQIVNRITAVGDIFRALGKTIQASLKLDFKTAKEGLGELGESVLQLNTGVDDLPNKIKNGLTALGSAASEAGTRITEAANKQKRIVDLGIAIEEGENRLITTRAKLLNQIKEEELVAKNTSLTAKERNDAAERARDLSKELLAEEQGLLNKKIEQKELEQSINDTSREEEKELQELKAQRIQKDTEQKALELKFLSTKKALQTEVEQKRKKAVDEAIKASQDQLALFIAQNDTKNKSFDDELILLKQVKDKKLAILKSQLVAGKLTQTQYDLQELEAKKEHEAKIDELEQEKIEKAADFENRKNELINAIQQQKAESDAEREELRLEQEYEKQILELENLELNEQQKTELLLLLQEQRDLALAALRDKKTKEDVKAEADLAKNKKKIRDKAFNDAIALAGAESKLGKGLLAIKQFLALKESIIEHKRTVGKGKTALSNTTIAAAEGAGQTAKVGFPQNIPLLLAYGVQIAGIVSAIKGAVSSSGKFEQGGLMKVGGKRHSQGGTKYFGEDGTTFEAEQGELIGVVNRNAAAMIERANERYPALGVSKPNYYQQGGIIQPRASQSIDYDLLASKIGANVNEAVANLPSPIVTVEDINAGQQNRIDVIDGANA